MAWVPDEVTGLGLRLGDDLASGLLSARGARQIDTDLAVDPRGVAGAVPAALRRSTVDVGSADALLCPADDLLGLRAVDRTGIAGPGVLALALVAALALVLVTGIRGAGVRIIVGVVGNRLCVRFRGRSLFFDGLNRLGLWLRLRFGSGLSGDGLDIGA